MVYVVGVFCEGEIGFVGYLGGEQFNGIDLVEVQVFVCDIKVDVMVILVGNVYFQ